MSSGAPPAPPLGAPVLTVVALGGAVGALLRYGLSTALPDGADGFPWTVFTVNVVGCALLALLPALGVVRRHALLPPLLGAGVLGGFTTLSAYAEQSRALAADGHLALAATYVVGTLSAALLAIAGVSGLTTTAARRRDEGGEA